MQRILFLVIVILLVAVFRILDRAVPQGARTILAVAAVLTATAGLVTAVAAIRA